MIHHLDDLRALVRRSSRILVLTGAGVSTASGIPDYRDHDGLWKRAEPMRYRLFVDDPEARRRYWARSFVGWPRFRAARPNPAHHALTRLEGTGRVGLLVTQNVDELHQASGAQRVLDLHGVLSRVVCLDCQSAMPRTGFQQELERRNPGFEGGAATVAPDGDADLAGDRVAGFIVPDCPRCDGVLKPDVVFFGENVPAERVTRVMTALERADLLLVVGSSLMVRSGYRFAVAAHERGVPVAIANRGRTRADDLAAVRVEGEAADTLDAILDDLDPIPA